MKKLIYISIFIIICATLFNKSYAQKINPAIIENVSESYAWDIVYQSFKEHNRKLNKYNKQTQTAKSIFYRYTSMMVDNRAKYQVTYKNGNIEIKFVNRQYLSKKGWVNNHLPLSKKTKKKYIYPITTTIRELAKEKNKEEENVKKIEKTKNENKEILGEVKGGKILMEKIAFKPNEKMQIGFEFKFRKNPSFVYHVNEIYIGILPKDTPLDFLFDLEKKKYTVTKGELETYKIDSEYISKSLFNFNAPETPKNMTTGMHDEIGYYYVVLYAIDPTGKKILEIDRKSIIIIHKEIGSIKFHGDFRIFKPGENIMLIYHEKNPVTAKVTNMWVGLLEKHIKPKLTPSKNDFISTKNITKSQNDRLYFKAPNKPDQYQFLLYNDVIPFPLCKLRFEVIAEFINTRPVADFLIEPLFGNTNTIFKFDASGCKDNEDPSSKLEIQWDWTNDNNWDISWTSEKTHEHQFTKEGIYTVKLIVKDSKGAAKELQKKIKVIKASEIRPEKPSKLISISNNTPPTTNCPKKEYEFYFPFDQDNFTDSLDSYAAQGYKLIAGSFAICFFEREVNSKIIYPIKVLKKTNIEELNNLAKQNWVVVNALFQTYLIQEKNPPLYKYKYCDDISNSSLRKCDKYLNGAENLAVFNNYGSKGWELVYIGGEPLFRKNEDTKIQYQYMSFNTNNINQGELEKLGKEGWQYCASLNVSNCTSDESPIILKRRAGMKDTFYFEFQTTEDPNKYGLSYFEIAGDEDNEKEWVKSFDPLYWNLNNFGQAGWTYEMFIVANEEIFGKDKITIVFQVPGSCR